MSAASPKTFLLVLHDAGGTVPPMLALARALVRRGNAVAILSQPSVARRASAAGCDFIAFREIGDYDLDRPLEEQLDLVIGAMTGRGGCPTRL